MGYRFGDVRCLIVKDNPQMRMLLRMVMKPAGILDIREASDGRQGYQILKSTPIDFCIVDWMMEPMNGIEFVRMVRQSDDSPNHYLPIIMLSGHTEMSRVTAARDAGVSEFLAKPFSAQALFDRITALIERPRPFIKAQGYVGPCRRRFVADFSGMDRRACEFELVDSEDLASSSG